MNIMDVPNKNRQRELMARKKRRKEAWPSPFSDDQETSRDRHNLQNTGYESGESGEKRTGRAGPVIRKMPETRMVGRTLN